MAYKNKKRQKAHIHKLRQDPDGWRQRKKLADKISEYAGMLQYLGVPSAEAYKYGKTKI